MSLRTLRFATFLAPNMLPVYAFIARHVQVRLGIPTELIVGTSYERLSEQAEVFFLCGLAYIELRRLGQPIEPLAAPLLCGGRYGGRPVYFSDVIVRRDSSFRSFTDLRGCSWAYNEPYSHSGPGITCYRLVELGQTQDYFGRVIQTGWHQQSIRQVLAGEVDASAVDSHVLALARHKNPELDFSLRVIDSLGPSKIQPVVVVSWLAERLKADLRSLLLGLMADPAGRTVLAGRLVERFVAIGDADYNDLRRMRAACVGAGLPTLRPHSVAC
jgi:phosphonate transport system substrate-binding protein